jgi:hypothetical protein
MSKLTHYRGFRHAVRDANIMAESGDIAGTPKLG